MQREYTPILCGEDKMAEHCFSVAGECSLRAAFSIKAAEGFLCMRRLFTNDITSYLRVLYFIYELESLFEHSCCVVSIVSTHIFYNHSTSHHQSTHNAKTILCSLARNNNTPRSPYVFLSHGLPATGTKTGPVSNKEIRTQC